MRTWALVQQKGGCGKSTIATNLAVTAQSDGETVLLVDLDPQSNALLWSNARQDDQPMVMDALPENLTKVLEAASGLGVTLAIIDTPSKIDSTALLAIRASDMIVTPTTSDLFSLAALGDTVHLLESSGKLGSAVAVINNIDDAGADTLIGEARAVLESYGLTICPVVIRHRIPFASAIKRGKGVVETMGKGPAAREIRQLWSYLDEHAKRPPTSRSRSKSKHKERS
jgi:chromosome partitioning protein